LHPARNAKLLGAPLIIFNMHKTKQVHADNFQLCTKPMLAMNFASSLPAGRQAHSVSLSRRDSFGERLVSAPITPAALFFQKVTCFLI
jgi:hypothetical protein